MLLSKKSAVAYVLFFCFYMHGSEVLPSDVMCIDEQWSHLDEGITSVRRGGGNVPDIMLDYPEGYYRGGRAGSEMMSSWLPSTPEYIYVKNSKNMYQVLQIVRAATIRSKDSWKNWAFGYAALLIASALAMYKLPNDSEWLALPIVLSIVSIIGSMVCSIEYGSWQEVEFLSEADKQKLMTALKASKKAELAVDDMIALVKTMTSGATEGLKTISRVPEPITDRYVSVYHFDPVVAKRS